MAVLGGLPVAAIDESIDRLFEAYWQNRSVYVFGNGGSASLASHVACDLGKGTMTPGKKPFRVQSLTDNVALITAWANDASYEDVFAAQLRCSAIGHGDIAFAISGSGNSPNVLKALRFARESGGFTIGLAGFRGGAMRTLCDLCIVVSSENMQQIEDCHVSIMHAVFLALRKRICTSDHAEALRASV
jgi:D-sedoheptulose 7-phosphate isomerase